MDGPDEEEKKQDNDANAEAAADAMKDTCDEILTKISYGEETGFERWPE